MNFEGINFPLYRKYKNNKSYFKIINPRSFEQIQVFGSQYRISQVEAKIFPDITFINDLISNYESMAKEITEAEYLEAKSESQKPQ